MKIKTAILILTLFLSQFIYSQNNQVVRILTYNVLNYPDNYNTRDDDFKKVIDEINPDIIVVQEMTSQFGVNTFVSDVLNSSYTAGPFIDGFDTDNAIFFKDSLITVVSNTPIHTSLRDISEFMLYHNFTQDTLLIYSAHLKANEEDSTQRKNEVNILRNRTNSLPPGTNYIVLGDFNLYRSSESAYLNLLNQTNNGYFLDPINTSGNWHNNGAYASIHTQSTCNVSSCPNGGSNGGLDDRFDFILISQSLHDTGGITYVEGSYTPFGNDGNHFNKSINDPPFNIITQEIANALYNSSDHLPVFADFDFGMVTGVKENKSNTYSFNLSQNFPNPFNPETSIQYSISSPANGTSKQYVSLKIYNILGKEVATLVSDEKPAGTYEVIFNSKNLPSGVYIYRLATNEYSISKKLTILK